MPLLNGYVPLFIDLIAPADSLFSGGAKANRMAYDLQQYIADKWVIPDPTAGSPLQVLRINAGGSDVEYAALGAGAHAADHILGGGDPLDADLLDIDFVPATYAQDLTAPHTDLQHLSAHLAGIDAQFTLIGDPATLLNGATPTLGGPLNTASQPFHGPNGETIFNFGTTGATAVNYLRSRNSNASNPCVIDALGTDTNIDVWVAPKGTGHFKGYRNKVWSVQQLTESVTLDATHCGKVLYQDPASYLFLTLSLAATLGAGWHCWVVQTTNSFLCGIGAQGVELLDGSTAFHYLYGAYTSLHVVCTGTEFFLIGNSRPVIPEVKTWATGTVIVMNRRDDGLVHIGTNGETFRMDLISNLPNGWSVWIKRNGPSVDIISTGAETFDGAASYTLGTDQQSVHVVSDGSNFHILGANLE